MVQPSFTGGEVSKAIQARIDVAKYATALKQCENIFVLSEGGISNRTGSELIASAKFRNRPSRLIPFQFSTTQTYMLEFGHNYMRVIRDGATVLEANKNIGNVSGAAGRTVTVNSHGYANGDWVFISGTSSSLDNRFWKVAGVTTNTFTLQDVYTDAIAPAEAVSVSGVGTVARVYEIATPYADVDLRMIRYTQDSDVMNLAHGGYTEQKLSRSGHAAWTIEDVTRTIAVTAPTNLMGDFSVSYESDPLQQYLITVVHAGGESGGFGFNGTTPAKTRYDIGESGTARDKDAKAVLQWTASPQAISYNVYRRQNTGTTPGVVGEFYLIGSTTGTEFEDVFLGLQNTSVPTPGVGGITPPTNIKASTTTPPADNDNLRYVVTAIDANTSEESVASAQFEVLATLSKPGARVTLDWDAVPNAVSYKVYKEISVGAGLFGYIGTANDTSFTDTFITPDFDTPPVEVNPFDGVGNNPVSVTYHKQRRVYGGTFNKPQTFLASKTGVYDNMNVSTPAREDDSYTYTVASQQVNAIRHIVSKKDLLIFTSSGEFVANGGESGSNITPSKINIDRESDYGCSDVPPLLIGSNVLFAESTQPTESPDYGGAVREFGYEFTTDGYRGNERTILARHLFKKWNLVNWAYAAKPYKIIWGVREDGELCAMTYHIEHDVWGWHRHVTDGKFEDVGVIRENGEDSVYLIVKRTINGIEQRFIERLKSREYCNIEDAFFVDSGLTYDGYRSDNMTVTISGGTNWTPDESLTLTASGNAFTADMVGKTIKAHLTHEKELTYYARTRLKVTGFINATTVTVKPLQLVPEEARNAVIQSWGVGVEKVTNLNHLEGKKVSILADGSVQDARTVTNGEIILDEPSVKVHVGLQYHAIARTLGVSITPFRESNSVTRKVNINHAKLIVEETRPFETGPSLDKMYIAKTRDKESWGDPTNLYSGPVEVSILGDWSDGSFYVRQSDPVPLTINSVMPNVEISDN